MLLLDELMYGLGQYGRLEMVKRILIVLVVLGLAWMAVSWMIGEKRRNDVYERRQAEYRAREESEIEEFLSKYEVVPDWEEQLCAGREIFDELMTADIERVWIGGRPIVYKGGIKDIAMHDERHYEVQLRMAPFSMMPGIMLHRLGLRVIADKQIIDRQLEKHPGITGSLGIFYTLPKLSDSKD